MRSLPRRTATSDLKPERVWEAKLAEAIRAKCLGKPGIVTEESKPTTSTVAVALRSDELAARGERPVRILAPRTRSVLAQALYERHKVLTYPRTDSRALPEDYIETVKKTLGMLEETSYGTFAGQILKNGWVQAEQAHLQQREGLGPLCHHPDHAGRAQTSERAGGRSSTTW